MHGHLSTPVNHQQQTRKSERVSRTGPHRSTTISQSPTNPHHENPETQRHPPSSRQQIGAESRTRTHISRNAAQK
ncbi:hypothetical protein BTHE_1531 [Bifidobacterium thermophilum]|nr:hypothetical protein BTHE_1531 [Bifidobacterium thermophilum]